MANRQRGETATTTLDGAVYTIAPSFNALAELQTTFGKKPDEVAAMAVDGDVPAMIGCIWSLLQKFHADEIVTHKDAGEWIDRIGGGIGAMRVLSESMHANMELHGLIDKKDESTDPLDAQGGTGERSSSVLAALA